MCCVLTDFLRVKQKHKMYAFNDVMLYFSRASIGNLETIRHLLLISADKMNEV